MFYLFHGPDEFTMREELARLRREGDFALSEDLFAGAETDVRAITIACDTLPFLSERRLVVVEGQPKRRRAVRDDDLAADRDADDRGGGEGTDAPGSAAEPSVAPTAGAAGRGRKGTSKGTSKDKGRKPSGPDPRAWSQELVEYVARLPETTILVLLVDELLESAHPLVAAAERHGRARAFVAPKGAQLESWLVRRAQARGARLAVEAARLLAGTGVELRPLAHEIDKLTTYAGPGGEIGAAEVRLLSPTGHQARVFDLTDALARRDRGRALALLHELLDAGESPLGIVALTAHQTRALIQVKALAAGGMRSFQIAQTAGLAPFVVEKSLPLARQFSQGQLEEAHRGLLRIDTALKLSKLTPEMALDLFVVEFGR
jgi:DNA polymerase-3 subunit delta